MFVNPLLLLRVLVDTVTNKQNMFWRVPGMNYAQLEVVVLFLCLTCVTFIGKHHGLVHLLHAMPDH